MNLVRFITVSSLMLGWGQAAAAQNWAEKMFSERMHDFGVVARGAAAEYRFVFENKYQEPIHVHSVSTSCKCISPSVSKDSVDSLKTAEVICKFETSQFTGQRNATVTVRFDKPAWAEVQLTLKGTIRGDITFEPGAVEFGPVDQGSTASRKLRVAFYGGGDWRIDDVKSGFSDVKVRLSEPRRVGSQVVYEMDIELLPTASQSDVNEQLVVCASRSIGGNRRSEERIPIALTARIESSLEVTPSVVRMGPLKPEETAKTKLVLKSKQPFLIKDVLCDDNNFAVTTKDASGGKLHLLDLSYIAKTDETGEIKNSIKILTDLERQPEIEVPVIVTIKKD